MPQSRRRRIVRRAVMALAVVVLLLAGYVGWYCVHLWDQAVVIRGNYPARRIPGWVFSPLEDYAWSDRPGSDSLCTFFIWSTYGGHHSREYCRSLMLWRKYELTPRQAEKAESRGENPYHLKQ